MTLRYLNLICTTVNLKQTNNGKMKGPCASYARQPVLIPRVEEVELWLGLEWLRRLTKSRPRKRSWHMSHVHSRARVDLYGWRR